MKLITLPAFLEGAVFLKRRKMPKGIQYLVCDPAHVDDKQKHVYDEKW